MRNKDNIDHKNDTYKYNNNQINYRAGTSDMHEIKEILLKKGSSCEYWIPNSFIPESILDIGANIGITSILFATKFPNSTIHAFEPLKENFNILKNNINNYPNITAHPYGLGNKDEHVKMYRSNNPHNFAAWSMYDQLDNVDPDPSNSTIIEIKDAHTVLSELGRNKFDLIKIDTEGAEYPIIKSIGDDTLINTKFITGELHNNNDYEFLSYLKSLGFNIRTNIKLNKPHFTFYAISDSLLNQLTRAEIRAFNKL
jgi:FkbM family methyltransferase